MNDNKENAIKTGPKDVFTHLLGFVALYVSIVSFLTLLFQYINVLFKDPLDFYYQGILNQIRWSTSALVVMFAVYLLVSWLLERDFKENPAKRKLKFRGWLVYLTLFAAAITIIIDLITLIFNFYSGEMTIRFFSKVLVVLITAVGVFGYYLWDLKREIHQPVSKKPKMIAQAVSLIVVVSVVAGFFIVGSPAEQRKRKFDEQRVSDLGALQSQIINYWTKKEKLPDSLSDLEDSIFGFKVPRDPESGESYEYNIFGSLSFELCAVFMTESDSSLQNLRVPKIAAEFPIYSEDYYQQNWSHKEGRVCFSRDIDPELYKKE